MKSNIQELREREKTKMVLDCTPTIDATVEAIEKDVDAIDYPLGCDKNLDRALCGEISFGNNIILCDECTMKLVNRINEIKQLLKGEGK